MISKFSKAAVFDVFVARRCGFRCYWMQEVVPRCAIFAKLQNSLIQPRTSQNKFSLFENVSFLVNPKIGGISERAPCCVLRVRVARCVCVLRVACACCVCCALRVAFAARAACCVLSSENGSLQIN